MTQTLGSAAVGFAGSIVGGAAALAVVATLYLLAQNIDATAASTNKALAVLLYMVSMATLVVAGLLVIAGARAAWRIDLRPAMFFWGLSAFGVGVFLTLLISALNSCEFGYAFPVSSYDDACR